MPPYSNMDQSHSFCDGPRTSSLHQPSSSSSSRRPALHQSQSNIETRHGLLHLAAMELEAMRSPKNTGGSSSSSSSTPQCSAIRNGTEEIERAFPPACLALLHSLPNNTKCHDCQTITSSSSHHSSFPTSSHNTFSGPATWASTSYGITLCLQCSGKHRSLGVQCSFIKSLTLDSWKRREILCMLEGGNGQLSSFFERHGMGSDAHGGGGGSSSTTGHGGRNQSNNSSTEESAAAPRKTTTTVQGLDRYKTKAASFYRQHLLSHAKNVAERDGLYEGREASRRRNSGGSNNSGSSSGGSNKHSKNKKNCSGSGSSSKKKSNKGGVGSGSPSCSSSRKKKSRQMMLPTVTENKDVVELTVGV